MPSFDTSEPISVTAQVFAGSIHFAASDRNDTVVDVRPHDPKKDLDVRAAEQTEVTYAGGRLHIKMSRQRSLFGRTGVVDVVVDLPTGSDVEATGSWVEVRGNGRLGEVRVKTSSGDIRLGETGPLRLDASHGSIVVDSVEGSAEITTSSGSMRVGTLDGAAILKNSYGTTTVRHSTGDLRISGAYGDIIVERAEGSVAATTAYGALRLDEVIRGSVQLETSYGSIDVGVRAGTAAWLDVSSSSGRVHNSLTGSDSPDGSEDTIEVRARTSHGNIDIHRAAPMS
ncbi:hypothetical protein QR77_38565 [Streptomyces sp. 150FB]|uniref:DUF4097 family beta strand repeat-containing protein n=1 Tax=Streptomyces sp. 150FB TaxID=1576605 RepID=UPI000588EBB0|nr:DUF4097 family beta strand repeat-containing protein [Streptomyces sp. 150FB]KIF78116.1 hypothetical protein QR77_38565 [Streptomyces sp. 150FB]